ncbi:uncharacterized protein [Procambarus clarkii]|uniref:uncharacterized protein isoform X2 n=1 Tax=Procambarus clarkii TaxID=6728 RepID=UPI003744A0D7
MKTWKVDYLVTIFSRMASNKVFDCEGSNITTAVEAAGSLTEENRIRAASENSSMSRSQDSGVISSQVPPDHQRETNVKSQGQVGQENPTSAYVTSTPIKTSQILGKIAEYEILPSQMILDDPLLSSIDDLEDITEHQIESLGSDDECENSLSTLHQTKIKADCDTTKKCSIMNPICNEISAKSSINESQPFSKIIKSDASSVKRNIFDIPVSPKLKSRVRQRLYTLVNSIDGYKGNINVEDEEENIRKICFEAVKSMSNSKLNMSDSIQSNASSISDPREKLPNKPCIQGIKNDLIITNCVCNAKVCKCHSQECIAVNMSQQRDNSNLNNTYISTLNNSVSERYGSVLSTVLESQVRTLQLHHEQLNQEKLSVAMQKKDQETQARISLYQGKLQQITQVMDDLKFKMSEMQKKITEQSQFYEDKIKKQDEKHRENLATTKILCEKKVHEAESKIREEITKSYEKKILEILSTTKEKAAVVEKEQQLNILQLNNIISKLKAEKKQLEALLADSNTNFDNNKLVVRIVEISKEKDAIQEELELTKQRLKESWNANRNLGEHEDISGLGVTSNIHQEDDKVWKKEAEKLQKKLRAAEAGHKVILDKVLQESRLLAQQDLETLQSQNSYENGKLNNRITLLQEKLSQAMSENLVLRQQSKHIQKMERECINYLSYIEALEKEVNFLRTQLQQAESQVHQERSSLQLLLKTHAEELAKNKEHHRKIAVRFLKTKLRRLDKGQ